jgi:hypothetical protein
VSQSNVGRRGGWQLAMACLCVGISSSPSFALEPKINYMLECQGCHLADGSGSQGTVPSLRDSVARFLEVPGGRAFLVQVPGSAFSPLSDADLAGVLNWMLREYGPSEIAERAPPYSSEEVARLRASPLTDVEGVRRELIAGMETPGE